MYCPRAASKKSMFLFWQATGSSLEDIDRHSLKAQISACQRRNNVLSRPPLANIDQVIIVQAIHQPEWHPLWCDRYLIHFQLELPQVSFVFCFNKCDLANEDDILALRHTYESLGYELIIASARTTVGLTELNQELSGKFSILAGPSGVGKSSLLNALKPGLNLKVGIMENEFGVGRHTTAATVIHRLHKGLNNPATWVADTPGFNLAELNLAEPTEIGRLFPEIRDLAQDCKYADCLHILEQDCNVLAHLTEINKERYRSYMILVQEAKEKQKLGQSRSTKFEEQVKRVGGKDERARKIPRLQKHYRASSRRSEKQKLKPHAPDDE